MDKIKKLLMIVIGIIIFSIVISPTVAAYNPYGFYDYGLFSGVMCIIYLIFLIVWLIVAIWAYKDANKRSMNGTLWAFVVFFLGLIGLIIYFVVRSGHNGKQSEDVGRICPACGRPIPMDAQICPYCGKDFRPPKQ